MSALLECLDRLKAKSNVEWIAGLEQRKKEELTFHDDIRSAPTQENSSNMKYYETSTRLYSYRDDWIRSNGAGKVFLDYACGKGGATLLAAQTAELSIGIDISPFSVEFARQAATVQNLPNAIFVQADCENTQLPDNSIDAMLAGGMLHHLDLTYAIPEIRRILKPGGKCLVIEPLAYNPAIRIYRRLTPHLRTEWESRHILSHRELRFIRRFMDVRNLRYWNLFSLLAMGFRKTPIFNGAVKFFGTIDAVALKIPPISWMAWVVTFEMIKRGTEP